MKNKNYVSEQLKFTTATAMRFMLFAVAFLVLLNQSANAATRYAVASGNWNATTTWSASSGGGSGASIPIAGDDVIIGETSTGRTVTIPSGYAAAAATVTIGSASSANGLTFAASSSTLTLTGNFTINRPANSNTNVLTLNAGSCSVGGNFALAGSSTTSSRIAKILITTGTLNISGNLTMASGATTSNVIDMSGGAGIVNLAGAFTFSVGTLTAGTSSTFNFNGTAAQTIPMSVDAVVYRELTCNNTNASGATLSAAANSSDITGNFSVQTGILNNGGFAVSLASGKSFNVSNGARFNLTGTSTMVSVSGGGTKTFGATSTVSYAGTSQAVTGETYGHLRMDLSGTATLSATGTVAGDLSLNTGVFSLGSNTINRATSGGTITVANGATLRMGGTTSFPSNYTAHTLGTSSTVDYNGTSQSVPVEAYGNLTISCSGTATLAGTTSPAGNLTVSSGTFDLGSNSCNRASSGGTINVAASAILKIGGTNSFPTNYSTHTLNASGTVNYSGTAQTVALETYGHLTLSTSGVKTMPGSTTTVAGNFTTSGTISATAAAAINVGGDVTIGGGTAYDAASFSHNVGGSWNNGGTFTAGSSTIVFTSSSSKTITGSLTGANKFNNLTFSGSGGWTFASNADIGSTLSQTAGSVVFNATSSARTLTVGGNFNLSGGACDWESSSGTTVMNISGNIAVSGSATLESSTGTTTTVNGTFVVSGTGIQTVSYATPANVIFTNFTVNNGATLQLLSGILLNRNTQVAWRGTILVNDGGTIDCANQNVATQGSNNNALFTISSGAKMITANATGVQGSVTTSNITASYNSGADYEFKGAGTGVFTTTTDPQVRNFTINRSAGVTMDKSYTVNNLLTLTSGNFNIGALILNLGSSALPVAGSPSLSNMIIADGGGEVRKLCTTNAQADYTFPIGDGTASANGSQYSPLSTSSSASTGATFTNAYIAVKVTDTKHTNNQSTVSYLTRFWNVTQSGITATPFTTTVTGIYNGTAGVDLATAESSISGAQLSGVFNQATNPWKKYAALASNTLTATTVTLVPGLASAFTGVTGAAPSVNISGTTAICNGGSTTLTGSGSGDASFTYLWSSGSAVASSGSVSPAINTTYSVTVTDGNGFTGTNSQLITVNAVPSSGALTETPAFAAVCNGADVSATLSAAGSGGAISSADVEEYRYNGTGTWSAYTDNANLNTAGKTQVEIRTYRTSTGSGCTSSTPVVKSWTVNAQPSSGTLTGTPVDGAVCNGADVSAALSAAGSGGAVSSDDVREYRYDGTGVWSAYTDNDNLNTAGKTQVEIRTYRTSTGLGCNSSIGSPTVKSWTMNAQPSSGTLAESPTTGIVCEGADVSATLSAAGSGGAVSSADLREYRYDGTGSWSSYTDNDNLNTTGKTQVEIRTYRTSTGSGCNSSVGSAEVKSWIVNLQPLSGTLTETPAAAAVCDGADVSATLSAAGTGGAISSADVLEYRFDGTGSWSSYADNDNLNTAGKTQVEIRTYRTSTGFGCNSSTPAVKSWVVNARPTGVLSGSTTICQGQGAGTSLNISVTGSGFFSGTLSDGTTTFGGFAPNLTAYLNPVPTGTTSYTVSTLVDGNCNSLVGDLSGGATITVITAPVSGSINSVSDFATGNPVLSACNTDIVHVKATGSPNPSGSGLQYVWNKGTSSGNMKFSSTGLAGSFVDGPFTTSGNDVYIQFGTILNSGFSFYRPCVKATTACDATSSYCLTAIRGTLSGPSFLSGSTIVCPSTTPTYTCGTSTGAAQYIWTLSGATFTNQGSSTTGVNLPPSFTTGQLCVTAQLACGVNSASAPKCVTLTTSVSSLGSIAGLVSVCPASTQSYSVPALNGSSVTYSWTAPAGSTPLTQTGNPVSITFPNPYSSNPTVCVTATNGCSSPTTATKCVNVATKTPTTPGNLTGPGANVCYPLSSVTYAVPSQGSYSFNWTYPTGQGTTAIATGQTNSFSFTPPAPPFTSGVVTVVAVNAACATGGTSPVKALAIKGVPATPASVSVIPNPPCIGGNIFTANYSPAVSGLNYTWGTSIGAAAIEPPNGGPSNNIVINWPSGTGTYTVNVTTSNACGASGTKVASFTGSNVECSTRLMGTATGTVSEASFANLGVYPNPAHDQLTVSIDAKEEGNYSLKMRDVAGRILLNENLRMAAGKNNHLLDISNLPKGIYMLEVASVNDNWKTKLVVE